ncbi:protein phosphatase 1 regulatory subunit 3G [Bombina bombina]|uniref:protein phosphatase 1 regulatory subunit 3G n=1 Tax=Bombina bombina TaxID=8345 RepID=UPI00235A5BE5|nr:protein phosphatase 1 regulatory subunit 3G [Bombina bombina]
MDQESYVLELQSQVLETLAEERLQQAAYSVHLKQPQQNTLYGKKENTCLQHKTFINTIYEVSPEEMHCQSARMQTEEPMHELCQRNMQENTGQIQTVKYKQFISAQEHNAFQTPYLLNLHSPELQNTRHKANEVLEEHTHLSSPEQQRDGNLPGAQQQVNVEGELEDHMHRLNLEHQQGNEPWDHIPVPYLEQQLYVPEQLQVHTQGQQQFELPDNLKISSQTPVGSRLSEAEEPITQESQVPNLSDGSYYYPEPLDTEEPPRRRAISLPENLAHSVQSGREEEKRSSLVDCCKLKKKVQFADSLGLCLASVKHFLSSDEPLVPSAVLARFQCDPEPDSLEELHWERSPAISPEQLARLEHQKMFLEQVSVSSVGIEGSVLVHDAEAQVTIRYTFNEWLSHMDFLASIPEHNDSPAPGVQRFTFTLCYPPTTACIHFAICCITRQGQEIWDNNQGKNYTVNCKTDLPPDIPIEETEQESWGGHRHW